MSNYWGKAFDAGSDFIGKISNGAGLVAAWFNLVLVILVAVGVFARYLFGSPIAWRDEICQYVFIYANLVALCYATYHEIHVSSDMLYEHLPPRIQFVITMIGYCLVLVCIVLVTYYGTQTTYGYYKGDWRSETDEAFLLWPVIAIVPIGFFLFGLQCIATMRNLVIRMKTTGSVRK